MYSVRAPLCINRLLIREFLTYVSLLSRVRLVSVHVFNSCISSLSLIKRRSGTKDPLNSFHRTYDRCASGARFTSVECLHA